LSYGGYTTSAINAGANAVDVKTALEALTSIGSGNVSVTKNATSYSEDVWTITFIGSLAGTNLSQMTINASGISSYGSLSEIETTVTNGHAAQDEIQTVTPTNATGGTFRLAYKGQTTVPLAFNASSSTVDSALEALSTIGSGAVTVSLSSGVYTITFGGGSLDNTNVNSLQGDVSTATYGTVDRTISTTYNAASQVTQVSDSSATIDYTLDNLGRATSIVNTIAGLTPTVTFDQVFSTGSDRTQLKAKISSTNDFKTDFTFDTMGRMTDIVQQSNSGNTVASKHVTLAYNKVNQFSAFNRYESTGTSNQVATTDFTYDSLNRLTDLDHKQGGTNLATYDYTYDYASRMTGVNSSQDGQTDYTHDATDQLTGADHTGQTDESYSFDANGNRSSYTIGSNNLITSDGTFDYIYDDEGNRTTKTDISSSSCTTYTWDYRNRLTAVKDYNSSNVLLKETIYSYDTKNRLVKSTYDADGAGGGAATTRFWAFDEGIDPLLEFKSGSASDVSHRYLWGPAVDELFADEQPTNTGSAGNILWGLGDNLGTLRDIADLSGSTTSVTNHRRFGAYGDLVSESNSAVDLIFRFTGKLYDENAKLQSNLNRWYDAAIGQWMSEDPIGFKAGDGNTRRYVGNTPAIILDSLGLQEDSPKPKVQNLKALLDIDNFEENLALILGGTDPTLPSVEPPKEWEPVINLGQTPIRQPIRNPFMPEFQFIRKFGTSSSPSSTMPNINPFPGHGPIYPNLEVGMILIWKWPKKK
jgi:RHS repeat-associated protein